MNERCELTDRQRAVVAQRCAGQTFKQIAASLGVGDKTIEYHWHAACTRIGAHDVALVTQWALKNGVTDWVVEQSDMDCPVGIATDGVNQCLNS